MKEKTPEVKLSYYDAPVECSNCGWEGILKFVRGQALGSSNRSCPNCECVGFFIPNHKKDIKDYPLRVLERDSKTIFTKEISIGHTRGSFITEDRHLHMTTSVGDKIIWIKNERTNEVEKFAIVDESSMELIIEPGTSFEEKIKVIPLPND